LTVAPKIREWRIKHAGVWHSLMLELKYVAFVEESPTPFSGGTIKWSYDEFLRSCAHGAIEQVFGNAVLEEALALVRRT
jgi:hypothetical protein